MPQRGPGHSWTATTVLLAGVLPATVLLATLVGCSAEPTAGGVVLPGSAEIRAAIAVVNAASASPADQRAALASVTYPAGRPALDRCPDTARTVRMEPVLSEVTAAPDFTDADGHTPPGTVLAVPALVRVHADGALATTEVTLLYLGVADGRALFSPLCLG